MYSSTLPSTSALDGGLVVNTRPRPLYPGERPGTHCIGGWVGPQGRSGRVRKISPPPGLDQISRCRWKDNIKMDFRNKGGGRYQLEWSPQDMDQ